MYRFLVAVGRVILLAVLVLVGVTFVISGVTGLIGHGSSGGPVVRLVIGAAVICCLLRWVSTNHLLTSWAVLVYVALFAPIVIVVLFAFNAADSTSAFTGFSMRWFHSALGNPAIRDSVLLSAQIAVSSAILSTILGTCAALALNKAKLAVRVPYDSVMFLAIVIPELMLAIGLLLFFVRFGFTLGPDTMMLAHAAFGTSLVTLIVRARYAGSGSALELASADLGASPASTFRQVTLPQLAPAIVVGFLLAFTFSFDNVVLSQFVSGSGSTTWPLYIYSSVRFGVSPDINAMAAVMLAITLLVLAAVGLVYRRLSRTAVTLS